MFLTPALLGLQPPLWERPLLTFGLFSKKMPMNPFASSVQNGTLKRVESHELILTLMVQLWARQSFNISFLTCKMMLLTKGNWLITWSPWKKVFLHKCVRYHIDYSSVQFSSSVMSDSLWPHGLQHAKLPCPSPTPRACSNSCPLSWWCHPTILSVVVPFSFCLQSFPASGSFPVSQFFASGDQSIGVSTSASVLAINI